MGLVYNKISVTANWGGQTSAMICLTHSHHRYYSIYVHRGTNASIPSHWLFHHPAACISSSFLSSHTTPNTSPTLARRRGSLGTRLFHNCEGSASLLYQFNILLLSVLSMFLPLLIVLMNQVSHYVNIIIYCTCIICNKNNFLYCRIGQWQIIILHSQLVYCIIVKHRKVLFLTED